MPFKNFGLDWKWVPTINSKNHEGMWGKKGRSEAVDFYNQVGIYVLQKHSEVVYVGKATSQFGIGWRLYDHSIQKKKKGKWNRFSWFGIRAAEADGELRQTPNVKIATPALLSDFEAVLIYLMDLKMNKVSGKYKHMTSYEQVLP